MQPADRCRYSSSSSISSLEPTRILQPDYYGFMGVNDISISQDEILLDILSSQIGRQHVLNVECRGDGSWEVCVLKPEASTLRSKILRTIPNANITMHENPFKPTFDDMKLQPCKEVNRIWRDLWVRRATCVIGRSRALEPDHPTRYAAYVYAYYLELFFGASLIPTHRGYLRTIDDASCLVQACLNGWISHSWRGPRGRRAALSGSIFVWKETSASINDWHDGLEWTIERENGFEVATALDLSGLKRKTVSIASEGDFYHVVGYYKDVDMEGLDLS